jgi:hypothetical protein
MAGFGQEAQPSEFVVGPLTYRIESKREPASVGPVIEGRGASRTAHPMSYSFIKNMVSPRLGG